MHLHHEPRRQLLAPQPAVHLDHRALDDVGGRALHRGVDRAALGVLSQLAVARPDLRQVQPAAEHGLDVALLPGERAGFVHVALHAGVAREVQLHVPLGLAALDAELAREPERRHSVDQSEVDGLRGTPLLGADLVRRHAEDLGSRRLVDVPVLGEGPQQALVPGEVRHDAQLDLRVVGRDQQVILRGHESLPDPPSLGRANRDVLEIRVGRRKPAGRGDGLVIGRVDAAGARVHLRGQLLGIGRAQLRETPVVEDDARQLVIRRQLLEHVLGRRGLPLGRAPLDRQAELPEQDLLQLLR